MKKVILVILLVLTLVLFTSCNKTFLDTTYKFNYAYVYLPNGKSVEGKVDSWTDFEVGDQLLVKIDGVAYLSNSTNIVLVSR